MISTQMIIRKKRDGKENTPEEISYLIRDYVAGNIPDYQVSAWLMACYFNKLNPHETTHLLSEMIHSGATLDWSFQPKTIVDKHSTGGVGDKTSLVIWPLLALEDCVVPMIAGRGLGHTGGTLDKLESIPGVKVFFEENKLKNLLTEQGGFIAGQTSNLVPADKKLYALRDVTGTVEQNGLIVASILSKKIAAGVKNLVLDVKFGNGAFMQEKAASQQLAEFLVAVGKQKGLNVVAALTNMNEPLGRSAGNSVEIEECLDILCGYGASDTKDLSLDLAAAVILIAKEKKWDEMALQSTKVRLKNHIDSGRALEKFIELMCAQGGNRKDLERQNRDWIDAGVVKFPVYSRKPGFVKSINTKELGVILVKMGAGRNKVTDVLNLKVGITGIKKISEEVDASEPLCFVHLEKEDAEMIAAIRDCFEVCEDQSKTQVDPLLLKWLH